jgi:hypothetical protein
LIAAVVAVYCPWQVLTGQARFHASDFSHLHARRMSFAQEALLGPEHTLPAWYPRELMGTPFRADLQNFPWIPTRLAVVLLLSPDAAFAASVIASAVLAAVFTFLFARRLGLSRTGAVAAGFTFACWGFYAARIIVGHLPLLEAYPALPALLWLMDRALGARPSAGTREAARSSGTPRVGSSLVALAVATASFALAGHPQLTVYSLATAACYALVRSTALGRGLLALCAMGLGLGLAAFALYPMALLAGRSTRILALGPASNDVAMPLSRLPALLFPWRDGWPEMVVRAPWVPFEGHPDAYFWDTVCYVGWAPCIAVAALVILLVRRRIRVGRIGWFFVGASLISLFLSSSIAQSLLAILPGTILRSPARLMYVVGFGLSLALGTAVGLLGASRVGRAWRIALLGSILAAHAADLTLHARAFIQLVPYRSESGSAQRLADSLRLEVGNGRAGIDNDFEAPYNRVLDDVGFFASVILARPYQFVLDTSGMPATWNGQWLDASQMSQRTLRLAGVRLVETARPRPDLVGIATPGSPTRRYRVPNPSERAALFPLESVRFKSEADVRSLLRDPGFAAEATLLLPESARPTAASARAAAAPPPGASPASTAPLVYRRISSDEIEVEVTADRFGWLRLLETWDPGWSASIDGEPVEVVPAHGTFLSVAVPAGSHRVKFHYRTPGAWTGIAISALSLLLLAGLSIASAHRTGSRPITAVATRA